MPPPIRRNVVPTEPEVGRPEPVERLDERVEGFGVMVAGAVVVADLVPVADDVPIG